MKQPGLEGVDGEMTSPTFAAMGKSVLGALTAFVPRALTKTLWGVIGGFFVCGFLGLGIAVVGLAINGRHGAVPHWLGYLNLGWVPFALATAGAYVGGANGFFSTLADEVRRHGLGVRLFGLLKPACTLAAQQIRARAGGSGVSRSEVLVEVQRALSTQIATSDAGEEGGGFERYVARRSRTLLCWTFVRTLVTAKGSGDAASSDRRLDRANRRAFAARSSEARPGPNQG